VAITAQQHIIRLDVTMYDAVLMQVVQGERYLAQIKNGRLFIEIIHVVQE